MSLINGYWTVIANKIDVQKLLQCISIKCTINSKINGTSKSVQLPISKLHSSLAVANLLPHNNLWLAILLLWADKFATAKIECIFEMGK